MSDSIKTRIKNRIKAHWPALRLRSILLGVLVFTALMPGFGAIFLRVYENVLVRQTEAELIAQAAVYDAAFMMAWPGQRQSPADGDAQPAAGDIDTDPYFTPEKLRIDLNTMPILPQRPPALPATRTADVNAKTAARAIAPLIAEARRTTLSASLVLDGSGIVVSAGQWSGYDYAFLPEVRSALAGTSESVLRRRGDYEPRYAFEILSRASAIRVHYARPILMDGRVVGVLLLSRSPRALFRGMYDDFGKIILGIGLILLIIIGIAGLLSRAIARPIEQLTRASAGVGRGENEVPPTPATATVEIRALFDNFRRMAEQIDVRSRYLRDFAAAMSHEFKTPLTGIRGALELIEEHGATMSEAERRRFIANARADAERLSRLVGRLLELARADMATRHDAVVCSVVPVLALLADALSDDAFVISFDADMPVPPVRVPAEVLETVLTTLVENSRQAGAGCVTITTTIRADAVVLTLQDDGPGVPNSDRNRLFEPFFTTRRREGGTGLGLAIARSLLAASGSALELVGSERGACFRLTMPL